MPGTKNMLIGLGIAVIGIVITGITFAVSPGGKFIVAYGAILVGALQFIVGFGQWLFYQSKSPDKKFEHHMKVDVQVLLKSMLAVAAADGVLGENEIGIIELVSSSLLGEPIDRGTIIRVFEEIKTGEFSVREELSQLAKQVTPAGAERAITAATMVALADGNFHKEEQKEIAYIAGLLRIQGERLNSAVQQARLAIES